MKQKKLAKNLAKKYKVEVIEIHDLIVETHNVMNENLVKANKKLQGIYKLFEEIENAARRKA